MPASDRGSGPPAIVGFELTRGPHGAPWPPPVHAVQWVDLGFVDHRDDQNRVVSMLEGGRELPLTVIVVCSLTTPPDRGVGAFLTRMQQASAGRVALVLSSGEALRKRSDVNGVEARLRDWRSLAARAGVQEDRISEIDLEHFTQASAAKLGAIANSELHAPSRTRRIDQAFALIASHPVLDGVERQAELHRQIMALYRDETGGWRILDKLQISKADLKPEKIRESLANGAQQVIHLLPASLRINPKWIAAGAAAGAMSCIAAATLIAPAAIAALPMWSGAGAAISAIVQPLLRQSSTTPAPAREDASQWVRSAALLSLILELQGNDQAMITRVLDRTLSQIPDASLSSSAEVRSWLDQAIHEFDLAMAQESSSRSESSP